MEQIKKFAEYLNWKYRFSPRQIDTNQSEENLKKELRQVILTANVPKEEIRNEFKEVFNQIINQKSKTMKDLKEVATELNDILFDESQKELGWIDVEAKPAQLKKAVMDAATLLEPEDEISEESAQVLRNMGVELPGEESEETVAKVEESEEAEEVEEPEPEEKPAPKKEKKAEPKEKKAESKKEKKAESKKESKKKEPAPKKESKQKEEKPAKKTEKKETPKKKKGTGVIATIAEAIENAGKDGISKPEILEILKSKFPDKNENSMKNTVNVQVPNRISKEKFEILKLEGGKYRKK